ncbi:hypothetical protein MIR68_000822 [Amoeboaphelidium protococcarum]|nr:hypothetical protein MIR68_000822 [Amoeboaphelidium protococcarum]
MDLHKMIQSWEHTCANPVLLPLIVPLGWWKMNQRKYPTVAKMVRDFLAVPSSSVASEQQFSQGGLIVSSKRYNLEPATIGAMAFLTYWLSRSQGRGVDLLDFQAVLMRRRFE